MIEVSNGDLPIPRGGYVVSGQGASYHPLASILQPGTRALVYTQLKGGKTNELPVELPTVFDLAINLKAAGLLEAHIPGGLVATADLVIE